MTDAIREDVSATPVVDLNDPNTRMSRNDAMKVMAAKRRATLAAEMAESGDTLPPAAIDEDTNTDDAAAEAARRALEQHAEGEVSRDTELQTAAQTGDVALAAPQVLTEDELARYSVRVKVNGREETVSLYDLRRNAQKIEAADEYMAKAKRTLADLEQVATAVQERAAATGTQAGATPAPTGTGSTGQAPDVDALVSAAVTALYQGDEAGTRAALKQLVAQPAHQLDPEAIARRVEHGIVIKTALRQFSKDHRDIAGDAFLRQVADQFLAEETQGRPLTEFAPDVIPDLFDRAGQRTKDWMRQKLGVAAAAQPPAISDARRNRKEGIDELPTASTRNSANVQVGRTQSDVIAQMAAQRRPPPGPNR